MPTKRVVLAATTASALAATGAGAFAFAPPPASAAAAGRRAAIARRPMSSVDGDVPVKDASWSIGDPAEHRLEAERKRDAAKVALHKLLERQQRDVQQTLDLLGEMDGLARGEGDDAPSRVGAASLTASVAAGADYGFVSRSEGCRAGGGIDGDDGDCGDARFAGYGPPGSVAELGAQQFARNLRAMIGEYRDEEDNPSLTPRQRDLQARLNDVTLSSAAIWEREQKRGPINAPWIIKVPYYVLCFFLDVVFEGRNSFGRFFLLETVARMPYFAYITMLHLYETLGFWRRSADIKRIHFAEEWNEYHHLMIMESLGGDQPYWVRFLAQHSALAYYVALCLLWMASPSLSYKFSEMLETHAVDTYGQFLDENEDRLRALPPSRTALEYYAAGVSDPLFGEYQTSAVKEADPEGRGGVVRRAGTDMRSLYDVFAAIRADEGDHVRTMTSCLDAEEATLSVGLENRLLTGAVLAAGAATLLGDETLLDLDGVSAGLTALGGLQGVEGLSDLDSILAEDGASGVLAAVGEKLAGLATEVQALMGVEGAEIDDDVAGSALEDLAAGGIDGLEADAVLELVKSIAIGILELIPFF